MAKTKTLDEESLGPLMDSRIREAIKWPNSKLSAERERTLKYYNGQLPKPQHAGSSSYVSTEVYDCCESMKAQLLETFAAGRDIVRFDPQKEGDVQQCLQQNLMTNYAVFRQNNGYQIFSDAIQDALTSRVGIAKVWWEESFEMEDHEFSGMPQEDVDGLVSMDHVTDLEAEPDDTGAWSGKAVVKRDTSQVRIEVINPEEFAVESQAKCLDERYFCVHQTLKTKDELIKMGYKKSQLEDIGGEGQDYGALRDSPEAMARFQQITQGRTDLDDPDVPGMEWLLVSECYSKFKYKDDKHAKLYKVVRAGDQTLEVEEVDELPFVVFTPIPIPHAFYGNNFGARIIPVQNARTNLIRSIIDHAAVTNNPRLQIVQGGVTNPRELLDNRLGGIINVKRPDSIIPVPQAPLNPFTYQTLDLLKMQKEEQTGISGLSQGLNKDAISSQNSQGMVQDLVNLSQTRQKIIARNFANQFLIPLWIKVSNLIVRNQSQEVTIEVAGGYIQIDPRTWKEMKTASVSLHLGYGELERQAMMRGQMFASWMQDPILAAMFTPDKRRQAAIDVAKMGGVMNASEYLIPAEQVQPPGPDPIEMAKAQNEGTKAQAMMVTAQAAMKKVDMHGAVEKMKMEVTSQQWAVDHQIKLSDDQRKTMDILNKIDVAQREITIAESVPTYEGKTLVSPN